MPPGVTYGALNGDKRDGLLEGFLARRRSQVANKLIPAASTKGHILDIGCGSFPFFLLKTEFFEKYGLDKVIQENYQRNFQDAGILLVNCDVEKTDRLPFDRDYFDVIIMPAVFEYIDQEQLRKMLREIYKVLKPGALYILTTLSKWVDNILRSMDKLKRVSPVEIEEHKDLYTTTQICSILKQAHFPLANLRVGYFEPFLNIWATATK